MTLKRDIIFSQGHDTPLGNKKCVQSSTEIYQQATELQVEEIMFQQA